MTPSHPSPLAYRVCAWLGSVMFLVALATCARFFLVLVAPAPEAVPLGRAVTWNVGLFTVFALHHSVLARSGAKVWISRRLPPALERSAYVWVASALLIAVCVLWQRAGGTVYQLSGAWAWLGWAAQAAGVIFTLAGARVLDPLELAGVRQVLATPAALPAIRVVWPFTVVRHPIYLGWVLLVFGAPVMTVDRLVWAVVSTAYLVIAIPWEERSLSAAAGPAYLAYLRRVRWRLVPGLY